MLKAKKSLSQNFLIDKNISRKIVDQTYWVDGYLQTIKFWSSKLKNKKINSDIFLHIRDIFLDDILQISVSPFLI